MGFAMFLRITGSRLWKKLNLAVLLLISVMLVGCTQASQPLAPPPLASSPQPERGSGDGGDGGGMH